MILDIFLSLYQALQPLLHNLKGEMKGDEPTRDWGCGGVK